MNRGESEVLLCDCRPDKLCLIFRPSLMSTGTFLFSLFANIVPSSLLFIVSHLPSLSVLSFHQNQWKSLKFHGILESDTLPVCLFPFPLLPLPGVYLLAQCLCIFDRLLCVCVCALTEAEGVDSLVAGMWFITFWWFDLLEEGAMPTLKNLVYLLCAVVRL